jgi:hypothetical protein
VGVVEGSGWSQKPGLWLYLGHYCSAHLSLGHIRVLLEVGCTRRCDKSALSNFSILASVFPLLFDCTLGPLDCFARGLHVQSCSKVINKECKHNQDSSPHPGQE